MGKDITADDVPAASHHTRLPFAPRSSGYGVERALVAFHYTHSDAQGTQLSFVQSPPSCSFFVGDTGANRQQEDFGSRKRPVAKTCLWTPGPSPAALTRVSNCSEASSPFFSAAGAWGWCQVILFSRTRVRLGVRTWRLMARQET